MKKGELDEASRYRTKLTVEKAGLSLSAHADGGNIAPSRNYPAAIFYWRVGQSSRKNRYANLALIELYSRTGRIQLLEREIAFLLSLARPLKLGDYIKELTGDEKLTIYVPRVEDFTFIETKCRMVSH